MKDKKITACCNVCNWFGSEHKLIQSLKGFSCPKCDSANVVVFGTTQTRTLKEQCADFAHYIRNGLTNLEYCQKEIEEHYTDFVKFMNSQPVSTK